MSSLHKSKQYYLIDMLIDTSRYLDDIFTIDNPEFEKHISDISINFYTENFDALKTLFSRRQTDSSINILDNVSTFIGLQSSYNRES